eukprot:11187358-Lingulodinium_polyedra.AAC.1
MIADALTKGSISRDALQAVMNGTLSILHKYMAWPMQAARSRAHGSFRLPQPSRARRHFG